VRTAQVNNRHNIMYCQIVVCWRSKLETYYAYVCWQCSYFSWQVWRGLSDTILNKLRVNQNNIKKICLNKYSLQGSTTQNYREVGILPTRFLFKKIAILFTFKRLIQGKHYKLLEGKEKIYFIIYLSNSLINLL